MAILHIDNFSLLDNPKTTGSIDPEFLTLKYRVYGTPDARVQTFLGRDVLNLPTRSTATSPAWFINYPIPNEDSRYVLGQRMSLPASGSVGPNPMGVVSRLSSGNFGMLFGFRIHNASGSYSVYLNYRNSSGVAAQETIAFVPKSLDSIYVDFAFDRVAGGGHKNLMIQIDNNLIFSGKAFSNVGTDLELVIAGSLPWEETVGSEFFAEFNPGYTQRQNFGYWITDLYVSEGGKRYGNPVVHTADMESVTSDLSSEAPLLDVLSGVPSVLEFAQGRGLTEPVFAAVPGEVAQLSALVQSNDGVAVDVSMVQGADTATTPANTLAYTKVLGEVGGPSSVGIS